MTSIYTETQQLNRLNTHVIVELVIVDTNTTNSIFRINILCLVRRLESKRNKKLIKFPKEKLRKQ